MATKTYPPKGSRKTSTAAPRDAWTQQMLERSADAFAFDTTQRRQVVEDMKFAFVAGNQWDRHLTAKRRNKPNYEFNRIRQLIRRVTGQQLKNKPEIKVRAVEDNDTDTADVYNGLIKNIEVQSSAENAYDTAFQWACGGGYGVLRVTSDYESDDSFDQCLRISAVMDPMTVWFDPAAREFDRSDARYVFITELIPRSEFKKRWPNAEMVDFDAPGQLDRYDGEWWMQDEVRVADYWYIEPKKKTIYMLSDGTVVDAEEFDPVSDEFANPPVDPQTGQPAFEPITIKQRREVDVNDVYCAKVSGKGQLEAPKKWGGCMIPVVPQWGDLISIDGKQIYSGMTRFGRDSQTIHNFEMSSMVEVVSKLPNMPLKATAKMIEGFESYYERLGYDDPPVLLYNVDPSAPSASPSREPMAQLPTALANLSAISQDELKATLGIYDASVGARSNESSGRAIMARQNEGDIANFVYIDNQVKALTRLGKILVDAIPHYYDAERSIRILGKDNAEKYVQINKPMVDEQTGETYILNDLSRGKYDVTVTVGKSYDTARMELADTAQAIARVPGPVGAIGQYLLIKSLDVPGIDEAVNAIRKVLVGQGLLEPKEGEQPPQPQEPNPRDVAEAQYKQSQAQLNQAKVQQIAAQTPAEVEKTQAQTAEVVAKIPGHEATGQQVMLDNMARVQGAPPLPDMSDQYNGGF